MPKAGLCQEELYDYMTDPGGTRSVHGDESYTGALTEMRNVFDGGWETVRESLNNQ